MKLHLSWLFLVLSLVAGAGGPRKVAVIVYFPSDDLTKKSAETAIERLKAKACGYDVVEIKLESNEKVAEKIAEKLKDEKIPPTAPVFLHGHGMLDGEKDHAFIARKPKLDNATRSLLPRQLVKGKELVKTVRETLKYNPVWISSCQSGGICFGDDACVGASCKKMEDSYGGEDKIETTLAEIVALMCDPQKFKEAAGEDEGFLTPEKLNAHFCKTFGEKKIETTYTLCPADKLEGADPITQKDFDAKIAEAKKRYGDANVKKTTRENRATIEVTVKGTACYKLDSGKTQMPQINSFRLYQHTYEPKPGELEGKLRGKSIAPAH